MSNHGGVHTGLLERTSEAMSHARFAAENARIGRLGAEEQRSKLHQDCAGSDDHRSPGVKPRKHKVSVAAEAEAGGSPSSEAPLGGSSGKRFRVPNPGLVRPLAQDESAIAKATRRKSGGRQAQA
jgi:hypothetical protein